MRLPTTLFAVILFLLPCRILANEAIKVGDETLSIPIPQGFVRYDGINPKIDQMMQSLLPATNRSLMVIATQLDADRAKAGQPRNLGRFMNVQTARAVEDKTATLSDFAELSAELEKQSGPGGNLFAGAESEANRQIAKLGVGLKLGETRMLGVFEKTKQSLDFGIMAKIQFGSTSTLSETMIAGASVVDVRGKVIFLYVYADYAGQADLTWVRSTVKAWRESIVAANPGEIPSSHFNWNSVFGKAVVGGIIGAVAGLIAMVFKKRA